MKRSKLEDMTKGWFVGDFDPTIIKTKDVEVGVKLYLKGEHEERHYHKIATELTVVISGIIRMNGIIYNAGEIVTINPFESTDFEALADTITVVVKHPGAVNDKYLGCEKDSRVKKNI